MKSTSQKPTNPIDIVRSKNYIALLVFAAIIGVPIAVFAYFFLYLVTAIQHFIYIYLPNHFTSGILQTWWPIVPLTIAGLLVGLIVSKLPGKGGDVPIEGFKTQGGAPHTSHLWGIALAAIVSIGFGAVVGPEAPLIALGGGLAYFLVKLVKKNINTNAGKLLAASGSFAAISTLLGSPLTGAFLMMEVSGMGGVMLDVALLPGILAAGIGYLIFVGLDSLTGLGLFSLAIPNLPSLSGLTISQFVWAIFIGLLAPFFALLIRRLGMSLQSKLTKNVIVYTTLAGLTIGVLAVLFYIVTKQSYAYVLFSGQDQLSTLISNGAALSLGTLLLILLIKAVAYGISLVGFRGGPTFPAMFLGAVIGVLLANITGMPMVACVAIGIGAMTVSMLRLPLTSILLTTIFLGADGLALMPIVIVAVVIAYVATMYISPKIVPKSSPNNT